MLMIEAYVEWVLSNPLWSAALQFSILGTAGEIISSSLRKRRLALPCSVLCVMGKILAWAILGIFIKYGFTGMKGCTRALIEHGLLPGIFSEGVGWAFAVSVITNLFFGPQMMFFHRLEDNLILWEKNYRGLCRAWWTLIWFWIPAHTVTFVLPVPFQIGLAALWSVALGIILGLAGTHKG